MLVECPEIVGFGWILNFRRHWQSLGESGNANEWSRAADLGFVLTTQGSSIFLLSETVNSYWQWVDQTSRTVAKTWSSYYFIAASADARQFSEISTLEH